MKVAEIAGYPVSDPDLMTSSSTILAFVNDPESLTFTKDSIREGREDGRQIKVNLIGGTYAKPINPSNWIFTGLPTGVTIPYANISRLDSVTVLAVLSGNRTASYNS